MSQRDSDHTQDQTDVPSDPALRVKALESLLVDKGLVDPAALDVLVETYENKVGLRNGAQVVARAWVDPVYKQRLLEDGTAALAEFGFSGAQGEKRHRVSRDAEERGMAERRQPGIAEEQIQAHGEEGEDQHLRQQSDLIRGQRVRHEEEYQRDHQPG